MSHVCRLCLRIWLLTLSTTYGNAPHPPLVGFKDLISISPGDWKDRVFEKQVIGLAVVLALVLVFAFGPGLGLVSCHHLVLVPDHFYVLSLYLLPA